MTPASGSVSDSYRLEGYLPLPGLFPTEIVKAFFGRMKRDLAKEGRPLETFSVRGSLFNEEAIEVYAYQHAPILNFLWGLTPYISHAVGCDLLPTYAYFRAYQKGDVCRIHSDRAACEHSVSLTLAYSDDEPWELSVAKNGTFDSRPVADHFEEEAYNTVTMKPGDAVLYQGIKHRHGRLKPNPNNSSAHLFLHWVDRNGPFADQAFDIPTLRRQS